MQKLTQNEIRNAFDDVDKEFYIDPVIENFDWAEHSFLSWHSAETRRSFICTPFESRFVGLVFKSSGSQATAGGFCDLCLSVRRDTGTKMFTVETFTNPRRRHGFHLCTQLDCNNAVRGKIPGIGMGETISPGKKIERMELKLQRIVDRLFLEF